MKRLADVGEAEPGAMPVPQPRGQNERRQATVQETLRGLIGVRGIHAIALSSVSLWCARVSLRAETYVLDQAETGEMRGRQERDDRESP